MAFNERISGFSLPSWEEIPDFGLYMDQVMTFTQRQFAPLFRDVERMFTPPMVNNYVKVGLISRPVGKKYGREQLAQLLMVCVLKQSASAEEMKRLLELSEGGDMQKLYEDFCKIQNAIFLDLSAKLPFTSPITCALWASSYRLLLSAVVETH